MTKAPHNSSTAVLERDVRSEYDVFSEQMLPALQQDWQDVGGSIVGTPAGIIFGRALYAFTRNTDGQLGMYNVGRGSWLPLGGVLASNPSVAPSPATGNMAVVARTQQNLIAVNFVQSSGASTGFTPIGGGSPLGITFVGNPVLVNNANGRLEAFSMDSNGNMWHTWQNTVNPPIQWNPWSNLGKPSIGLLTSGTFVTFLLQNNKDLQSVSVGNDNKFYQATQFQPGGNDSWSAFTPILPNDPNKPAFLFGTAGAYSPLSQTPVYAGWDSVQSALLFAAIPQVPAWTTLPAQFPSSINATPLLVNNLTTSQLIYVDTSRTVQFVSQTGDTGGTFWGPIQQVGSPNVLFTGQMSAVVNAPNVALFQTGTDGHLYFINYTPSS